MPPRKETREAVVYPASKRKVPAFKPLRPSKVPRIATTESESSVTSQPAAKKPPARKPATKTAKSIAIPDSDGDDDDEEFEKLIAETAATESHGQDSDVPESDALKAPKRLVKSSSTKAVPTRDKTTTHEPSPMSVSDESPTGANEQPMPTQSDDIPSVPQPLLLRLLHEAFANKNTQIDRHAIQVFQKYVEIFVREAIARAQMERSQAAASEDVSEMDKSWLEVDDLEKAAPGLFLDF